MCIRDSYIANEDDAMVTVVDMNDKMIIDDIPVGVEPEGMGLTNDGKILVNTSETVPLPAPGGPRRIMIFIIIHVRCAFYLF